MAGQGIHRNPLDKIRHEVAEAMDVVGVAAEHLRAIDRLLSDEEENRAAAVPPPVDAGRSAAPDAGNLYEGILRGLPDDVEVTVRYGGTADGGPLSVSVPNGGLEWSGGLLLASREDMLGRHTTLVHVAAILSVDIDWGTHGSAAETKAGPVDEPSEGDSPDAGSGGDAEAVAEAVEAGEIDEANELDEIEAELEAAGEDVPVAPDPIDERLAALCAERPFENGEVPLGITHGGRVPDYPHPWTAYDGVLAYSDERADRKFFIRPSQGGLVWITDARLESLLGSQNLEISAACRRKLDELRGLHAEPIAPAPRREPPVVPEFLASTAPGGVDPWEGDIDWDASDVFENDFLARQSNANRSRSVFRSLPPAEYGYRAQLEPFCGRSQITLRGTLADVRETTTHLELILQDAVVQEVEREDMRHLADDTDILDHIVVFVSTDCPEYHIGATLDVQGTVYAYTTNKIAGHKNLGLNVRRMRVVPGL